ncbi:MAG: hypothetical protein KKC73_00505 [Proteobacteria bacterium]|nr:hypothetical protein [Pseudomonadota bacterium]
MKVIKISVSVVLVFAISVLLSFVNQNAWSAEQESYCFTCHTSAKELIRITREIAEADKGKPGASTEAEKGG